MTQKHQRRHNTQHLDTISPEALLAKEEHARIQKLRSKVYLSSEEDDEEEDQEDKKITEDSEDLPKSSLLSLKFMKRKSISLEHGSSDSDVDTDDLNEEESDNERNEEQSDIEEEDSEDIILGKRSFKNSLIEKGIETSITFQDDISTAITNLKDNFLIKKIQKEDNLVNSLKRENEFDGVLSKKSETMDFNKSKDNSNFKNVRKDSESSKRIDLKRKNDASSLEFKREVLLKPEVTIQLQRSLVAEAFENDVGVVTCPNLEELDFAAEKATVSTSELPQPFIDTTLIGWGSWAGCGISAEKKKKVPRLIPNPDINARTGVLHSNRKDALLPNVIIREKKGSKQAERKYQLDRIPYPYDNEIQFNAANYLVPVGKEWNPESIMQKMISPRISQELKGKIIKPISYKKKT